MQDNIDKRRVLCAVFFTAADLAAAQWVRAESTSFSHTLWDICGVITALFLLKVFFKSRKKLLPTAACIITMSFRAAQAAGIIYDITDSSSLIGGILGTDAYMGDMLVCLPIMAAIYPADGFIERIKSSNIPLWSPYAAFAVISTIFAVAVMLAPAATLLLVALTVAIAKTDGKLSEAVRASLYIFAAIIALFAGYAIITIQFSLL